jgi:hypothetical protein
MYAEDPDDSIEFQMNGSKLDMIDTPFVKNLNPVLIHMLKKNNSVPSFLSSVTLELFENQTLV